MSQNYDSSPEQKNRIWKKEYAPIRTILLWGWDEQQNPCTVFLYGIQKYQEKQNCAFLDKTVTYTKCAVFKGKEGHMPSFFKVKLIRDEHDNTKLDKMYFKTGVKYYWSWDCDEDYAIQNGADLKGGITLPYYESFSFEDYGLELEKNGIDIPGITLMKDPNELLKLDGELLEYQSIVFDILHQLRTNTRKNRLAELVAQHPPKALYQRLLEFGSVELLCGLFLELSKQQDPILLQEAKQLQEATLTWNEANYIAGLKRCAKIYTDGFSLESKQQKIDWIAKTLPEMDLHLQYVWFKPIPAGKVLTADYYHRYLFEQVFSNEEYYQYDRYWSNDKKPYPNRYLPNTYNDGRNMNFIQLKDTFQTAVLYQLTDILGKMAYYLDAPRLYYYFHGSGNNKIYQYYLRYIKRILNHYAQQDPDRYIQMLKVMLMSYQPEDVISYEPYAPQLWKIYLYHCGSGYYYYYGLMRENKRKEYKPELWDNHLNDAIEIAISSRIDLIQKAFYMILKDAVDQQRLEEFSFKQIVQLSESTYQPLSKLFGEILCKKLKDQTVFCADWMLAMMDATTEQTYQLAREYFSRTNGKFIVKDIVVLLCSEKLESWLSVLKEALFALDGPEYISFLNALLESGQDMLDHQLTLSQQVVDILSESLNKMLQAPIEQQISFVLKVVDSFLDNRSMPEFLTQLIEEALFSLSYEELSEMLGSVTFDKRDTLICENGLRVLSLLKAIQAKTIPEDSAVISILESGTSKMVKILIELLEKFQSQLHHRHTTLLMLFESDVYRLNDLVKNIFAFMEKDQKVLLHQVLLDSPVEKVYQFALEQLTIAYQNQIPEKFLLRMLEHPAYQVKAFISNLINETIASSGLENTELYLYYVKTLLYLPNKVSKQKMDIYQSIPTFIKYHAKYRKMIEDLLLDIGSSNHLIDSERALVTLAQIRKGDF